MRQHLTSHEQFRTETREILRDVDRLNDLFYKHLRTCGKATTVRCPKNVDGLDAECHGTVRGSNVPLSIPEDGRMGLELSRCACFATQLLDAIRPAGSVGDNSAFDEQLTAASASRLHPLLIQPEEVDVRRARR